jgi:putative ABC transport system substrate-binding protein
VLPSTDTGEATVKSLTLAATFVLGVLAPVAAGAQTPDRVPRIGLLTPAPATVAYVSPYDAFRQALAELGHVESRNVIVEFRGAGGDYRRLAELAADLARLPVDVIVTDGGGATARAALTATRTIPIVMGTVGDTDVLGLVKSLARPGGNLTGFVLNYGELAAKRLQLLKEIVPAATRVAVLLDPVTAPSQLRPLEPAARSLRVQLIALPVRGPSDLDVAFETARRERADALLQLASRMLSDNRAAIAERVLKHRLPGMFELGFETTSVLVSYGPRVSDNFRRAAAYVDKILKGARADTGFQHPHAVAINERDWAGIFGRVPHGIRPKREVGL